MYNILEIEIDDPWEMLIFGGVKLQLKSDFSQYLGGHRTAK